VFHAPCFLMCILFYVFFIWLHVYAFAIHSMVHCGSAFEPGASGLPYYCTSVCVRPCCTGRTSCVDSKPKKKWFVRIYCGKSSQFDGKKIDHDVCGKTVKITVTIIIITITIPQSNTTTNIQIHHFNTTFMCPRSIAGVPFGSVGPRRFRATLLPWLHTTCMHSCCNWCGSGVAA